MEDAPPPARCFPLHFTAFSVAAIISAWGIAYAADAIELQLAGRPIGIFPTIVGGLLGGLLYLAARLTQHGHRATLVTVAVLAGLIVVACGHWFAFERYRAGLVAAPSAPLPNAELLRELAKQVAVPETFVGFMQKTGKDGLYIWWLIDAAVIVGVELVVSLMALRRPYCNVCRHWYSAAYHGTPDPRVLKALVEQGRDLELPDHGEIDCEVLSCRGNCGPLACDLSWRTTEDGWQKSRQWVDRATYAAWARGEGSN